MQENNLEEDNEYLEAKKLIDDFLNSKNNNDNVEKKIENFVFPNNESISKSEGYTEYDLLSSFVQGALWMREKLKGK